MAYYREGIFPRCTLGAFPILDTNSPTYTCSKGEYGHSYLFTGSEWNPIYID